MTWNTERGRELTVADLRRATELQAGAGGARHASSSPRFDVLACPVSQVAPFDVELDWVHDINGRPQDTYLDWMASCYRISVTGLPGHLGAGRVHARRAAGRACSWSGRRRADWDLLSVAHAFEAATGYGQRLPA